MIRALVLAAALGGPRRRELPPVRLRPARPCGAGAAAARPGGRPPAVSDGLRLAGWVAFTGIAWWVYYAMAHFGGIPPFVAVPLMLLMTAIMAAFWGLFAWAHARLRRALPALPDIVVVPVLWTAAEYLRGVAPRPGVPLGAARPEPVSPAAADPDRRSRRASGRCRFSSRSSAPASRRSRATRAAAAGTPGGSRSPPRCAALALCGAYGWFRLGQPPEGPGLRVAVVQGSVPQDVKWDRRFREETFRTHEELTRAAAGAGADLVVWSESATAFVYQREPEYQQRLAALVAGERHAAALRLAGVRDEGRRAVRCATAPTCSGRTGEVAGWQDKQQLVPFGEFVPFKRLLFFARPLVQAVGNFEPGERPEVLSVPGGRFGTLVCYEVIFPDLVRRFAAGGGGVAREHHERRLVRAQRGLARSSSRTWSSGRWRTAGRSRAPRTRGSRGSSTSHGRILSASELFVRGQYRATLALSRRTTLYTRWGDWLPRLCVLIALALLLARTSPDWVAGGTEKPCDWLVADGDGRRRERLMRSRCCHGVRPAKPGNGSRRGAIVPWTSCPSRSGSGRCVPARQ